MTVSSLLLSSLDSFLVARGTAAGDGRGLDGTAAGVGLGDTAAGVGLGLVGGESRGLPVVAGWLCG